MRLPLWWVEVEPLEVLWPLIRWCCLTRRSWRWDRHLWRGRGEWRPSPKPRSESQRRKALLPGNRSRCWWAIARSGVDFLGFNCVAIVYWLHEHGRIHDSISRERVDRGSDAFWQKFQQCDGRMDGLTDRPIEWSLQSRRKNDSTSEGYISVKCQPIFKNYMRFGTAK